MRVGLFVLAFVGCGDPQVPAGKDTAAPDDTSADTGTPDTAESAATDVDRDGYAVPEDCDDADPDVRPGAVERCDSVDEDCDGTIDEDAADAPLWFADADGDGFGGDAATTACEAPADHAAVGDDCDDTDPAVSPAGVEVCGGADEDCDGAIDEDDALDAGTWYADADADGYGDTSVIHVSCVAPEGYGTDTTDCDDADAAVNPGAIEVCGGGDEDCDGAIDEDDAADVATWYADGDADGYGDVSVTHLSCVAPAGFGTDATDCDDADASANPGAIEVCGGVDEDCDGAVDEDDASDAASWYADADADGYGDVSVIHVSCIAPVGYGADATDCDDADATANPGSVEVCGGVDEDCDGAVDEDDASDASTWYADADADGYGDTSAIHVSCVAPAGYGTDATDCDDADPAVSPAATEVCDGGDEDCDGVEERCVPEGELSDDAIATLTGSATYAHAGDDLAVADLDGDGADDLLVGAGGWTPYVCTACVGSVYVLAGPVEGTGLLEDAAWAELTGDQYVGYALASAGDVDGDGAHDLLIGDVSAYAPSDGAWRVRGLSGGVAALDATADTFYGVVHARAVASGGDVDGDGVPEVLVGGGSDSSGRVWLFDGSDTGTLDDGDADVEIAGDSSEQIGYWPLGGDVDIDGDGVPDVWIATPYGTTTTGSGDGGLYVFYGPLAGSLAHTDADLLIGGNVGAYAGYDASVGDTDADGYPDLLLAGFSDDTNGSTSGAAWLFLGPLATGTAADADAVVLGAAAGDRVGQSVDIGGDVDGDGAVDLLVGALGAAGLFYGPIAGTLGMTDADATFTSAGSWLEHEFGDFDGDGYSDLAISDSQANGAYTEEGVVWVVPGG